MDSWERFDETLSPDKKVFYSELNVEDITDICVYPFEYMDSWERFDESLSPDKKVFYSKLNVADITDICVYPYEYIDSWERFDETLLPDKKAFYSELNLEDITDKDYEPGQKVWEVFGIKNLGEYHDLYVQSDTLLLADMFENIRDKCIEINGPDPAHFLSAPGLAWEACLKKTKVKLELLTDIDMLLIVEKGISGEICQAIHRHAKVNNKYMENYNKDIISSYLMYLDANNLYG